MGRVTPTPPCPEPPAVPDPSPSSLNRTPVAATVSPHRAKRESPLNPWPMAIAGPTTEVKFGPPSWGTAGNHSRRDGGSGRGQVWTVLATVTPGWVVRRSGTRCDRSTCQPPRGSGAVTQAVVGAQRCDPPLMIRRGITSACARSVSGSGSTTVYFGPEQPRAFKRTSTQTGSLPQVVPVDRPCSPHPRLAA